MRLSARMVEALNAIRTKRAAFVSTDTDTMDDVDAFIHWRTAEALERRGLIRITDGIDITFTDKGRDAYDYTTHSPRRHHL